ncbi:c-type cytochrome domain-containing protein [Planctomycetes bacterium K23_9]|uniref:Planctomycete cytochrome C n=1 Tax=Stieleria marina TaxID=1930275 RepID=A0A517NPS5_9BACT|nr:Planctomycete cytochrome C [Planctomycetes bacterium K23_9]
MRLFSSLAIAVACCVITHAAELSSREKSIVASVNTSVKNAGADYAAGKFDSAGQHVRSAMNKIDVGMKAGSADLYEALAPAMKRISKAHAMLDFEGVSLPPFRRPKMPAASTMKSSAESPQPDSPLAGSPGLSQEGISFTKQVAPILTARCGRCHIEGSKGQFNLGTFASLMKGPPEGVVVFAGDTVASRLIQTIVTGDMPRGGGKVTPPELAILNGWIIQGAKFDGADPTASIASGMTPAPAAENPRAEVKRATGNETVSFARDVAPILVGNCNGCHINAMQVRGGLRMDSFNQIFRGGDSGEIIVPGKSADSLLIKKIKGMGIEGERMPAGGRPALSDADITLISTWIDEGATLDGASETQPISVMAQLAWAANASAAEMSSKRQSLASENLALVANATNPVSVVVTDHFYVTGTSSKATLETVGAAAEQKMKDVQSVVSGKPGEDFFHGRASIFVLPQRYDYSEFAKMVEQRSVPTSWTSHWKFNGVDAYVAVVASDREEEDTISDRLLSPIASLAVATRGNDVPRWFAEGVGTAVDLRGSSQDRIAKSQREAEIREAVAACKDAKGFLGGKLSPVHTDRMGAAMVATLMDRQNRKRFDACLQALDSGKPFNAAFAAAFQSPVNTWVNNWLNWAKGS